MVDSSEFRLSSLTAAARSDGITATFVFEPLAAAGLPIGVSIVRDVTLYENVGAGGSHQLSCRAESRHLSLLTIRDSSDFAQNDKCLRA